MRFELTNADDVCVTEKQIKPHCGTVLSSKGHIGQHTLIRTDRHTNWVNMFGVRKYRKVDITCSHMHPHWRAIGQQHCELTTQTQWRRRRHRKFLVLQFNCWLLTNQVCFYFDKVKMPPKVKGAAVLWLQHCSTRASWRTESEVAGPSIAAGLTGIMDMWWT